MSDELGRDGYKAVPVTVARSIAEQFDKSMVVILAYDPAFEVTHTTTYGVSAFEKENAAAIGEKVTKAIGGDLSKMHAFEDFHKDYDPARYRELQEAARYALEVFQGTRYRAGVAEKLAKALDG